MVCVVGIVFDCMSPSVNACQHISLDIYWHESDRCALGSVKLPQQKHMEIRQAMNE